MSDEYENISEEYERDDKPIYVRLEPDRSGATAHIPDTVLVKTVDSSYLDKKVYDLVQKVLDPEPDIHNPNGYNTDEKELAGIISGWYREKMNNPDMTEGITLSGKDKQSGLHYPLDIDELVSEYDWLISRETETDPETNSEITYKFAELGVRRIVGGGYENIE